MPKIDLKTLTFKTGSRYPAPFGAQFKGRSQAALGDPAGITQFGANLVRLAPGAMSSLRHWHENQDEFLVVTEGALTLIDDTGETALAPGDCCAFPAGDANGHHIVNRSDAPGAFVVVGTRTETEIGHYSDVDLKVTAQNDDMIFTRRDGTPFDAPTAPAKASVIDLLHHDDPMEVLQALLDRQAQAILLSDARAYAADMDLPYRRVFANDTYIVETTGELIDDVTTFSRSLRVMGANHYIQLATAAEYLGPDHLAGHFVTHVLQNASSLVPSFENRCVLKRQPDGVWAMNELETNVEVSRFPVDFFRTPNSVQPLPLPAGDDARRRLLTAMDIYQGYLDQTARTVAADDFDGYCALMEFPYTAHGSALDQTIRSPADLRPFYETLRRCHDGTVGDRIERIAERAEFLGGDLICGYHAGSVFKGAEQTVDTVRSSMILKRSGARWRLQNVNNSIDNRSYPFSMYEPGGQLRTHLEIQKRTQDT